MCLAMVVGGLEVKVILNVFCRYHFELYIPNKHLVFLSLPRRYLLDRSRRDVIKSKVLVKMN